MPITAGTNLEALTAGTRLAQVIALTHASMHLPLFSVWSEGHEPPLAAQRCRTPGLSRPTGWHLHALLASRAREASLRPQEPGLALLVLAAGAQARLSSSNCPQKRENTNLHQGRGNNHPISSSSLPPPAQAEARAQDLHRPKQRPQHRTCTIGPQDRGRRRAWGPRTGSCPEHRSEDTREKAAPSADTGVVTLLPEAGGGLTRNV